MKRTLSIVLVLIVIFTAVAFNSCELFESNSKNVVRIERIIKSGMKNNDGRYNLGMSGFEEVEIVDGQLRLLIYVPIYSSQMPPMEDMEILTNGTLSPYAKSLYFEFGELIDIDWESHSSNCAYVMTGKLYYISPESGEKIELDLK